MHKDKGCATRSRNSPAIGDLFDLFNFGHGNGHDGDGNGR